MQPANITSQGYFSSDVGNYKVAATQNYLQQLDPALQVTAIQDRWRPTQPINPITFCCVDNFSTCSVICKHLQFTTEFLCDGRILGETLRVLTACDHSSRENYHQTLFL